MSVRRSIIVLTLIVLVLPVAIFAASVSQPESAVPDRRLQTHTVASGSVELTVNAIGRVEADRVTRLSFTSPGRLVELTVQAGQAVSEGDLLARIADDLQVIAVQQAELGVEMAQLQRDRLLAGPDETQITIAQANIDAARGAVIAAAGGVSQADIQAAELAYAAAQQALTDAQAARATAPGDQAREAYDLLEARIGQASFNVEIARLQLESLRTGGSAQVGPAQARLTQAERELERLLAGPSPAEIERADAQVAQAQLQLDAAVSVLERTVLVAPYDGVVTAVNAEQGGLVAPGLAVVEVTDIDPLRLTVQVDEIDVRAIREGIPARVRLDALQDVLLDASLERIALLSTNDAGIINYDVDVRLSEADPRVRIGMTAEASVVVESREDVIVIPNEYVRLDRQANRAFVNLLRADGTLEEVEIILGIQGQTISEVVTGLQVGDVIAVDLAGDSIGIFGS